MNILKNTVEVTDENGDLCKDTVDREKKENSVFLLKLSYSLPLPHYRREGTMSETLRFFLILFPVS